MLLIDLMLAGSNLCDNSFYCFYFDGGAGQGTGSGVGTGAGYGWGNVGRGDNLGEGCGTDLGWELVAFSPVGLSTLQASHVRGQGVTYEYYNAS